MRDLAIWSNDIDNIKAVEEDLIEDGREKDNAFYEAEELLWEYLEDEETNLSSIERDNFVAVGNLVRWDGGHTAFKDLKAGNLGEAITETIGAFGGDNTFKVTVENEDVILRQWGHDNPVSPSVISIRALKRGVLDKFYDAEDALYGATRRQVALRTEKLGGDVARVYGVV